MPKDEHAWLQGEPQKWTDLPRADIDVSGPKVDINVPDVNDGPDAKLKVPSSRCRK